jgi:serine/threonine-protein kinase
MGTVFLANHLRLPGRQVAIKVLRNDAGLGKDVFVRFRREAEIASRLAIRTSSRCWTSTTCRTAPFPGDGVPARPVLSRRMRRGPLTLEEVFFIAGRWARLSR